MKDSLILKIENLIQIKIKNLKDVDVSDMIRSMLGKKSSSKELDKFIKSIITHTKGNPLFIREILYYLQEKSKITIENNKWKFPKAPEIKELPKDIYRIIQERIHELSDETLITLQAASVIGKKFSYEMLRNMTQRNENELLDDLIDCREVSLIEESGNDYIFIHDKVREVVENEVKKQSPTFWKDLHLRAGEYLEEKYSSNKDEVIDDLANHFYFCKQYERSVKYLKMTGIRAKDSFLNERAIEYFKKLTIILEEQYVNTNKNDIQFNHIQKNLYYAYFNKGKSLTQIGKWSNALADFLLAKKVLEQMTDKQRLAEIYHAIGWCFINEYDFDNALCFFDKELKIAEKMDLKNIVAQIYTSIGVVYLNKGDFEKQLEYNKRSLEILKDFYDAELLKAVYSNMGSGYRNIGNYEKALEFYQKSLIISEQSNILQGFGFKWGDSILYRNFGWVQREQGNFDEAIKFFNKAIKIAIEVGDRSVLASYILDIGEIYYYKKKYDKALEYVNQAINIQEEFKLRNDLYFSLVLKIDILTDQKKYLEIQKAYGKLLKNMPKHLKSAIFNSRVLSTRISFFTENGVDLKIKKGVNPLEKILEEEKDEERHAKLNYELAIMNHELNRENIADKHKKTAIEINKKLYNKTPKIMYNYRIKKMEKLKTTN